ELTAFNLGYSDCCRRGLLTECSGEIDFHVDRAFFCQPINKAVILVCDKSQRDVRGLIAAEGTHIKEIVSLATIKQDYSRLFLADHRHHLESFLKTHTRRMRKSTLWRDHCIIGIFFRLGWNFRRLIEQKHRSLELAFEFCQIVEVFHL